MVAGERISYRVGTGKAARLLALFRFAFGAHWMPMNSCSDGSAMAAQMFVGVEGLQ
jgi:hypothetical protein